MTTLELLSNLRSKDIEIWADGDQLGYKAPKGALTPDLREELAAHKSEILALLRQTDTATSTNSFPLKRVSRAGDLPLSFAQERLWFLHHLEPDSVAYSLPGSIRLKGMLNKISLEKTFFEMARRHETLRTTFHSTDGNPVQRIAAEPNIEFDTVDLRHLPEVEREAEVKRLSEEDARKPFDLTRGPLFRIRLFQLEDEAHVLHFNRHHIIYDYWSFRVMMREIAALYTAFIKDKPANLPELPVQYADYAVWQRQWLQGEALEGQLNYWKDKLGGELPVLELPTDRPRPAVQTHRGAIESFTLSKELTDALQTMSRHNGVTLFMTLLAAFKTLLYRHTGQEEIIVGTPIAGRNRTELEGLIGFFLNTLVMRTDLSGQPTFQELLGRVRETALGAYAHQDIPFERLVEELSPERDLSRTPLFQVFFNHMVAKGDKARELPGLETEAVGGLEDRESMFDMTLHVLEGKGGLTARFEYSTDLFDAERIERMVRHFQTLLEGIVADPEKCICDLPILDEAEGQQLLVEWNDTFVEYPRDKCIHELFETQVESTPDAAAVIFGKQRLTYRDLNARANQLAHYLQSQGVVAESRVGLWMERSLDMVVALLGTLKAGGAYVPLDPSYPQERLAFMLEDAQAPVLLTREKFLEDLPAYAGHVACMDKDYEAIAGGSEDNPISGITADSAAYVIYTSGSTGTPKGVIGLHRGAVNRLSWMWRVYPFKDGEVCCQKTYMSFVDSIWEIFGPLLKGVPAVIIPDEVVKDPHLLVDNLAAARVSRILLVPSLLRVLLDNFGDLQKRLFDLKIWVTSGEEISVDLAQRFRQLMPEAKLINLYGSSEVSADVSCYEVADGRLDRCIPIGRPIDNTSIYILDSHLQPVPIGVPAELYIGGVGLARGYLNQPDLTAERFIPSPFGQKEVLFKTGDLGRYLAAGNIEYLGRIDHQVKVRGFRIELGEIESQIKGLEAVSNCVVALREDRPGDQRLTAYYVCKDGHAVSESEVRRQLQAKLPEYMVPQHFVEMSSVPLTPNGKVDRQALPKPQADGALEQGYVAPRTEAEQKIAAVWQEVLNRERVGIHDNFFELGGHSLLVMRVISRIREAFQLELPLRSLFEAPSVAGLTERIETARRNDEGLQTYPLQAVSRDQNLPLSFAQERLWFLHHLEPDSVAYSMPRSIRLKGVLRKSALEKTYVELARRHETLRTTFHSTDGNPLLRIAAEPNIEFDTVDLSHLPEVERETEAKRLSEEDARKPFDLTRGPLFRVRLFQLEDEEHVLHSNMHHIISDFWSFGVMAREIAALYTAFIKGKPADLPELPVQYADYAFWQRQWLQGEALGVQLNYWKDKLGGELPVLELPTDRPRPAVQTHRGAIESLALSKELTDALQAMSRREGVTLFMTLLAAFKTLLYRHTGQEDTIVGTPIAGRNRTELEGLIGFFMNTIVMRTDLSGQPSFRELLGRVRETALSAYAHQDMPFAKLVEELAPERDLSRTPLFQVFFNHIVAMGAKTTGLPGLKSETVGGLDRESKFDMTLTVLEGKGGLAGRFEYNTDLFDAERIERMAGHFQTLLEGIVADPGKCISDLPLLPVAERDQLLLEWNDTRVEYRRDEGIHQLFESQAERSPEAVAVVFEDDQLTYGELEHRANQLAHHLQALGVGPDTLVGIYMERSVEMMVGLLGVLKAGGAYVPLDPAFPQERLAFMLADSQAPVLLTQQRLLAVLPESEARVLCLDTDWPAIGRESEDRPVSAVKPTDLAYVIYTSGSTGKPKGVQIPHRAGVNFLNSMSREPGLSQQDVLLAVTTLSFDIALLELFLPIIVGARVVIVSSEVAADGYQLQERMTRCGATVMQATPATWRLLLETDWPGSQQLKVLCGGEGLPRELANQLLEQVGSLWNMYGPTETTVWSTVHAVESGEGPILIGRPIDNTETYILDSRLRPVPIGVPGELYIGGDGLARGYFNRSNLTAEKFIAHPFSEEPQARIYNTGDMARYLPDGTIECLGRMDHQVKIRGFRIELGEIEAVLGQHLGIEESVVIVREDVPGDKRLVGYLIANQEPVPTVRELRNFLKQKLPDYMVPSAFVELEAMPLTPNRKVDRHALPKPETDSSLEQGYVAPRTEAEQKIAAIWQKVLNREKVGVLDDFFELGGHSLLATQVMSRINRLFNIQLPLRRLFEATSIEALAEVIDISSWNSQDLQKSDVTGIEEREVIEL